MKNSGYRTFSRLGTLEGRLLTMCVILVIVGAFFVVKMPAQIAAMEEQRKSNIQIHEFSELFADIYSQIKTRYVEEVESKKLFEGAINGMMTQLDPHSSWMPPEIQERLTRDTEGEYSGVGLEITQREGILTVISPLPGSPAGKVGVMPWDRIIEIDGKSTADMNINDAVKNLTGPTGTTVKVKIWREGKTFDVTIERQTVHIVSVFSKIIDGNIGYLRIARFQEDTAKDARRALEEFNAKNVQGVIVDLRGDSGGLLNICVEVCNLFLPKGQLIVSIKGRNPSDAQTYKATEDELCHKPLVVLVNRGSASASEIFAGAMQDTGRGLIIGPEGTHTFGKGSVQTISDLRYSFDRDANGDIKHSGLRLTTARYYTPSGHPILQDKGIKPDIGVKLPPNHEAELLLRGGMLGDYNVVEPGKDIELQNKITLPDGTDKIPVQLKTPNAETTTTTTAPKSSDATSSTTLMEKLDKLKKDQVAAATAKQSEPFHDIQLEESIKYLKVMLIGAKSGHLAAVK